MCNRNIKSKKLENQKKTKRRTPPLWFDFLNCLLSEATSTSAVLDQVSSLHASIQMQATPIFP